MKAEIIVTLLVITLTMDSIVQCAKYYDPVAPIPIANRNDKPQFIPCGKFLFFFDLVIRLFNGRCPKLNCSDFL